MASEFSSEQVSWRDEFRSFVAEEIAPHAAAYDRDECIPAPLIAKLARRGYLGMTVPQEWGGRGLDVVSYGLLHHEVGRSLSSLAALITVHDMTAHAIARWGSPAQKRKWLPRLTQGKCLGAFCVSEVNAGSDVRGIETLATRGGPGFVLNGKKKWITAGQIADLFLVLARLGGKPTAFLVERERTGVSVKPILGMLGLRAGMLAEITLQACEIPEDNLIAGPGFGIETAIQTALDLGRYTVGWGSVGLAQACLDLSLIYASERKTFGVPLQEHQLIAQMISEMICQVSAAGLLCLHAGRLRQANDAEAMSSTLMAKYFASRTAMKVASDAVQIHGANGCSSDFPLQRYLRDAKVMEIIEGSSQIQQILIAKFARRENAPVTSSLRSEANSHLIAAMPRGGTA